VKLETDKIIFAVGGLILGFGILDLLGSLSTRFAYAVAGRQWIRKPNDEVR
jgi:hypothetical protein